MGGGAGGGTLPSADGMVNRLSPPPAWSCRSVIDPWARLRAQREATRSPVSTRSLTASSCAGVAGLDSSKLQRTWRLIAASDRHRRFGTRERRG